MLSNPIQQQLQQPETEQAIIKFLENFPKYQKNLDILGDLLDFGQAVLLDKQSISKYDQLLRSYNLNVETALATISLIEKLPSLNKRIDQIDNILSFVEDVLKDEKSLEYVGDSIETYTKPIINKVKELSELWKDIQHNCECQESPIKITTVLKWLRDPSVQKALKYVHAILKALDNK